MMEMKQFKKFLDMYGADITRWDGVDEKEVRGFMNDNKDAEKLYAEVQQFDALLDCYKVDEIDDDKLIENVMGRIGQDSDGAKVVAFPGKKNESPMRWGYRAGGMAIAASLLLAVWFAGNQPDEIQSVSFQGTVVAVAESNVDDQMDVLLAEVEQDIVEEATRQEIERIWVLAENQSGSAAEEDLQEFLDDLFGTDQPPPQDDIDIWDYIMGQDIQEL